MKGTALFIDLCIVMGSCSCSSRGRRLNFAAFISGGEIKAALSKIVPPTVALITTLAPSGEPRRMNHVSNQFNWQKRKKNITNYFCLLRVFDTLLNVGLHVHKQLKARRPNLKPGNCINQLIKSWLFGTFSYAIKDSSRSHFIATKLNVLLAVQC